MARQIKADTPADRYNDSPFYCRKNASKVQGNM